MHGRDSSHKAREGSQYEAVADRFISDQGEHISGDEKEEGWVRVLLRWRRVTHRTASIAGGGHRHMLQVLEAGRLGTRMPRRSVMPKIQGGMTLPMGMPQQKRERWRYKEPKCGQAKSDGRPATRSKK